MLSMADFAHESMFMQKILTRANRFGAGKARSFIFCCIDPAALFEPARSFTDVVCLCRGKNCSHRHIDSAFLSPHFRV
jgi:hypothetical protein